MGGLDPKAISSGLAALALAGTVLANMAVKLGITLAYARAKGDFGGACAGRQHGRAGGHHRLGVGAALTREAQVDDNAVRILDSHRIMAISTVRPDGWPQTTIVGYANDGLAIYFIIFRSSQKFANIQHDDRVSIAVGEEPRDLRNLKAVYAGAHAIEVNRP